MSLYHLNAVDWLFLIPRLIIFSISYFYDSTAQGVFLSATLALVGIVVYLWNRILHESGKFLLVYTILPFLFSSVQGLGPVVQVR